MWKGLNRHWNQYKSLKPYHRSFGFTLLVFIGVALVIVMVIDTWYNIHIQEQQLNGTILTIMDHIAQTVTSITRIPMLENKGENLQQTINDIARNMEGVERIRIFDNEGMIKSTTIPGESRRIFEKGAEQCVICHSDGEPVVVPPREKCIRVTPSDTGDYRVVSLTYPVYNEERCYIQCHEYHPKDRRVLGIFEVAMSLRDVDEKIAGNRRHFIQISVISFLVIMVGLSIMLFYSLVRPMNTLLTGIRSISLGNFSSEIPVFRRDEFGRLAQSLNNMLQKLRKEIAYRNLLLYDAVIPDQQEDAPTATDQEDATPAPKKEEASDISGLAGIGSTFEDIYERIRDETHMKLVRSVKLASLGQLSAGIAHEINNPLTAVLSYSSLLLDKAKNPKERQWLNIIVDETKRCRNIVAGLLEFARQSTPEMVTTQVNDVIERAVSLVETKESFHNIKIIKDLDPTLPKAKVDRGQIYQVLTNLIINAGDAMEGKGTLTVASRMHVIESRVAEDHHFVEVSVSDTGCGIPEQNMERLFDPFFTTKGPTVGTGLGLSICFGIIKRHGGNITVRSKVNEGSTFIIHLPVEMENEHG
ncbi:MAG: sensor histidine kinase [bacterium]